MGEAKKRQAAREAEGLKLEGVDISNVCRAVRSVCQAASTSLGGDCFMHAWLTQEVLKTHHIDSVIEVGHAAWRVGDGDGDVLTHVCSEEQIQHFTSIELTGRAVLPFHVWLEVGGHILDSTLYQIPGKAAYLDSIDGGATSVEWKPDYLFEPLSSVSSMDEVIEKTKGLYFYKKEPRLKKLIFSSIVDLDPSDVQMVLLAYRNPQAVVVGPNMIR